MSYYYEDGLRREDKVFLRSMQEHNYKGATYQLKEPWKVVNWMHNSQFETAECLNYQLLDALLTAVCHPVDVPVGMKKRAVDYEGRLYRLVQYIFKNNSMEFLGAICGTENMETILSGRSMWTVGTRLPGC